MSRKDYDARKFSNYLKNLIESRGLSMRQASLQGGMDHGAAGRFIRGRRPHRDSCLLLAEVLEVDANEMLAMAGYEPMPVVDRSLIDPHEFPPEVKEFAKELSSIAPERRREIMLAVRTLVKPELSAS